MASDKRKNHIIVTVIEHPAAISSCARLEAKGFAVTYLLVNTQGVVSVGDVTNAISDKTFLISIMHANNKT